jgi:hypothetical protein
VNNVNSQSFNVSLAVHQFVWNLLWQECQGIRKRSHFQLLSAFSALCHTLERCMCSTPSRKKSRTASAVYVCAISAFMLALFLAVASIYKILWKSRCSLTFFE